MGKPNKGDATSRRFKKLDQLTPGEQRIWDLAQTGFPPSQIAEKLGLRLISVNTRLYTIREKLRS